MSTELATASVRIRADLSPFAIGLARARTMLNRSMGGLGRLGSNVFGLMSKAIGGVISIVGRLTSSILRLARRITMLGAAIVGAGLGLSVREFAGFNQALTESVSIMNVTEQQARRMKQTALELGAQTIQGPTKLAESYFFLASAGLDAEQSMAALPQVATFATAGMFDMATATDLLTDAQSALGLTVKDTQENMQNMARVGDVLVKANTLANASVQQFSESLTNKAAAAARNAKIEVEEVVAVLAAFADQGVKGATAGNAFNIVLRDLQTKAIQNAKAFREANIAVFDGNGNMREMSDIIADLERHLGSLSTEQQKATLLQLGFTDKSIAFVQTLLGMSEGIRRYHNELKQASGTMQSVADRQMASFTNTMKQLWNEIKVAAIQIGESLAPAVVQITQSLARLAPIVKDVTLAFRPLFQVIGQNLAGGIDAFGKKMKDNLFAIEMTAIRVAATLQATFEELPRIFARVLEGMQQLVNQMSHMLTELVNTLTFIQRKTLEVQAAGGEGIADVVSGTGIAALSNFVPNFISILRTGAKTVAPGPVDVFEDVLRRQAAERRERAKGASFGSVDISGTISDLLGTENIGARRDEIEAGMIRDVARTKFTNIGNAITEAYSAALSELPSEFTELSSRIEAMAKSAFTMETIPAATARPAPGQPSLAVNEQGRDLLESLPRIMGEGFMGLAERAGEMLGGIAGGIFGEAAAGAAVDIAAAAEKPSTAGAGVQSDIFSFLSNIQQGLFKDDEQRQIAANTRKAADGLDDANATLDDIARTLRTPQPARFA